MTHFSKLFLISITLLLSLGASYVSAEGGVPPATAPGVPAATSAGVPPATAPGVPAAPPPTPQISTTLQNPLGDVKTFQDLVAKVLRAVVTVAMPFVVLAFIWTGFMFVRAQGNDKILAKAKESLWYTIIGAFILLGAWGFAQIIATTVTSITGLK